MAFFVVVGKVFVVRMFGNIKLLRKERPYAAQLQDALAAIHNGQLILAHQLFSELLVIERVGGFSPTALAGIVGVDCLFPKGCRQLL